MVAQTVAALFFLFGWLGGCVVVEGGASERAAGGGERRAAGGRRSELLERAGQMGDKTPTLKELATQSNVLRRRKLRELRPPTRPTNPNRYALKHAPMPLPRAPIAQCSAIQPQARGGVAWGARDRTRTHNAASFAPPLTHTPTPSQLAPETTAGGRGRRRPAGRRAGWAAARWPAGSRAPGARRAARRACARWRAHSCGRP